MFLAPLTHVDQRIGSGAALAGATRFLPSQRAEPNPKEQALKARAQALEQENQTLRDKLEKLKSTAEPMERQPASTRTRSVPHGTTGTDTRDRSRHWRDRTALLAAANTNRNRTSAATAAELERARVQLGAVQAELDARDRCAPRCAPERARSCRHAHTSPFAEAVAVTLSPSIWLSVRSPKQCSSWMRRACN